jgi:hypothetical protein
MMADYKHTQIGFVIIIAFAATILFIVYLSIMMGFNPVAVAVLILLLAGLGLFATLTVKVDDRLIEIRFGPGVVRKGFPLKDVAACRAVKNPWYYGWGIHLSQRGWVYNVSGLSAVELRMENGRTYRIGTDDAEGLVKAIEERLGQK